MLVGLDDGHIPKPLIEKLDDDNDTSNNELIRSNSAILNSKTYTVTANRQKSQIHMLDSIQFSTLIKLIRQRVLP